VSAPDFIKRLARDALSAANGRTFDGNDNFRKVLCLTTCSVGPYHDEPGGFVFEAKIPRSAVNELPLSETWTTNDRAEAAKFLREIADEIERTPQ
jgi:hypothetical protein